MWAGTPLEPLAALTVDGDAVVFPEEAWTRDRLLGCLADVATTPFPMEDLPPPLDQSDALLIEHSEPLSPDALRQALEQVLQLVNSNAAVGNSAVGSVARSLIQHAQFEGPLRLIGGPPTPCADLQTFMQHLSQLMRTRPAAPSRARALARRGACARVVRPRPIALPGPVGVAIAPGRALCAAPPANDAPGSAHLGRRIAHLARGPRPGDASLRSQS